MNESLKSWRNYYCDSSTGSQQCARYALSVRGEVVPLGLLPNGRHAQHIQQYAGETAVPAAVGPGSAVVIAEPAGGDDPILFQPMHATGEPRTVAAPTAQPLVPLPRRSIEMSSPRDPGTSRRPVRRWWTRLTDWMKGHDE